MWPGVGGNLTHLGLGKERQTADLALWPQVASFLMCDWEGLHLSFAKTPQGHNSRPATMLQARPRAIHFKSILDFGEGQHYFCN